jgi:hypothetical protein
MYKPSKEEIENLKAKYGKIFKITVGDKSCILKSPTRKDLSYASTVGAKDPLKFNEVILKNCFVEGDREIVDSDEYFLGASSKIQEIIEVKEASLEKL